VNSDKSTTILNSELAYDILKLLASKDKGDYGKSIAEDLDKPQSSICRALTSLTEEEFVSRGKRTRAQYYEIDYEGIADYWYESLLEELPEDSEEHQLLEENREDAREIGKKFFHDVMDKCDDSQKVSELLYNSFIYSLGDLITAKEDYLSQRDLIRSLSEATMNKLDIHGHPDELNNIINEIR